MVNLKFSLLQFIFGSISDDQIKDQIKEIGFGLASLILLIILLTFFQLIGFLIFLVVLILFYGNKAIFSFLTSITAIDIARFIDFICFCLANWILYLFFDHFLFLTPKLVYLGFFALSVIIIKTDWVLRFLKKLTQQNTSYREKRKNIKLSQGLILKFFPITIKQLFFNTFYSIFPIYLIWISSGGFLFLLGFVKITPPDIFLPYIFEIIVVISILLGIFEYFLKRQEEKVFNKIIFVVKKIGNIINQETSFDVFYQSIVEKDDDSFIKWIITQTNPQSYALNILPQLLTTPRTRRAIERILLKTKVPLLQLSINYADSDRKFKNIEEACLVATDLSLQTMLIENYRVFFGQPRDKQIILKIKEQIDLEEFENLTLSNINILHEILTEFISIKSRDDFNNLFNIEDDDDTNTISSSIRRETLRKRIMKTILEEILT